MESIYIPLNDIFRERLQFFLLLNMVWVSEKSFVEKEIKRKLQIMLGFLIFCPDGINNFDTLKTFDVELFLYWGWVGVI